MNPFLVKVCGRGFIFASTFGDDHWVDVGLLVSAAAMLERLRDVKKRRLVSVARVDKSICRSTIILNQKKKLKVISDSS